MFKRILIATDFSQHAYYALERAISFAASWKAELTCVHVLPPHWGDILKPLNHEDKESDLQYETAQARKAYEQVLKKSGSNYPSEFIVLSGRIPDQLIEYSEDHGIDFIFMGAHGAYYLNDYILGTNSASVVKESKVPVQLIKKSPSEPYQRILISTDFSETSKKAAECIYQAYPEAQFLLLHVADVLYGKLQDNTMPRQEIHEGMIDSLEDKLQHFLEGCAVDQRRFSTQYIGGYPADDIARYATQWGAQLVVAGTRGHSMLHYLFIGRVAKRLLRIISTDIAIIPARANASKF